MLASGEHLSLVLESAGGRGAGSRPRNDQYVPALTLLLDRLRDRQAVLVSGVVASARTAHLPEEARSIVPVLVELAAQRDINEVRLQITRAQGRVGLPDGAAKEGNNRKRIELRLAVPGYGLDDAGQLAADLAAPAKPVSNTVLPPADELLHHLTGETILTVAGRPNKILGVQDGAAHVATDRSPKGQPVAVADVQYGLDLLAERGSVRVSVDELGHRSAFVGAILATLPHVRVTPSPATVTLAGPGDEPEADDSHFGELDVLAQVKVRTEQAQLRRLLGQGRDCAPCALCGDEFPVQFLVAAHVKKRAACTDAERRNLRAIAMLACSFGCDALYESGWVTVDETGRIQTVGLDELPAGNLKLRLVHLTGRRCDAHRAESEPYFAWHRKTTFRGNLTSRPRPSTRTS
ncbi:hypothetical protein YIM_21680 [Amycolatopsis sp. YIM 10]|nr:hypothetical protein YIM_21680 [Amycolatopsis sp. YIM 10]